MSLLIGADVGTSALKAVLVEPSGKVLAVAERAYPLHHPHPGWAENDPEDWYRALVGAIHDLLTSAKIGPGSVGALCIAGQRDNAVLIDAAGRVVTPSIHWSDRRDPDETEVLFRSIGRERIIDLCGVPPTPGLVLPNLVWTRRHLPDAWVRTRHVLQPKDYLAFRLTGEIATDVSSPSRSLINDWRHDDWSPELCAAANIPGDLLPPVRYRPWEPRASITARAAAELGLRPSVVLAAGGGDDQSATLGCGVVDVGDVSIGTGSSMCWRIVADEPAVDPDGRMCLIRHVVPDRFMYEMIAVGTGTSLKWYRDTFARVIGRITASYEDLIAEADTVAPGADGLLFYPYVAGASMPLESERASGVFFGIRTGHEQRHFVRAIMEGCAYLYPGLASIVTDHGASIASLTMVDGEARSGPWNRIKANVLGQAIRTPRVLEAAAVGSAILAGVASGAYATSADGVAALVGFEDPVTPDEVETERYAELRVRWERIRRQLFVAFDEDWAGA